MINLIDCLIYCIECDCKFSLLSQADKDFISYLDVFIGEWDD